MRVTITTKKSNHAKKFGKLIFDDGTVIDGEGFGYSTTTFGEIVFNYFGLDGKRYRKFKQNNLSVSFS